MFWHIDTDMVGMSVMCVLLFYTQRMQPDDLLTARNKGFIWCLRAGIVMTVLDIAASLAMDMPVSRFLCQVLMTLYLLTQVMVTFAWLLYALTILYEKDVQARRRYDIIAWSLYAVFALLTLTNPWTGWFFTFGPNMEYARGILFLPCLLGLSYAYGIAPLILTVIRRKHIPAHYPKVVLIIQPIILSVAIFVQLLNPGWLLIYSAYMLCLLLAFLFFQNLRVRNDRIQLQRLTQVVDHFSSGMSICEIKYDGTIDIRYLSGAMAEIYETDAPTLQKQLSQDILYGVHTEDREKVRRGLLNLVRNQVDQDMTYRYFSDKGTMKWINIKANTEEENGQRIVYATYSDVTDLIKIDRMLDTALTNTGVSLWEYDYQKRCIIQYQNSTQMHGFQQIVPNVPQSLVECGFVHPDSAEAFYAMYQKLADGAPFAEGVFRVQTNDRCGYWYEHIRYTNAYDKNGKPYRAVGMSTDDTARQEVIAKYERELEKERSFMVAEDLLAHATFDLSTGETLDYIPRGDSAADKQKPAFSYGRRNLELLIDEDERKHFMKINDRSMLLARFSAGETEFKQEYRRKMPDGSIIWVRNILRLLRDPHTDHVLLFEYWYNIESEKMQALMYRSIAANNYDYVACINGKTKHFEALPSEGISSHVPPLYGENADAVTFAMYDECVLPEDREAAIQNSLVENIKRNLAAHHHFTYTYRMTQPDGSLRHKKITQYYIDPQREMIAIMREDITELMHEQSEQKRILSEALESANQASQAKSQFLSHVSHELRTPLNAIIGFMELSKDAEPERMRSYLVNSESAAKQLLSIINDVLDMSSIESGKLKIAHAPFDMKSLIQNINDLYLAQCRQKGLNYTTSLATPVDEWLIGDPLRVNQILLNLLNNALKFTQRGEITLRISQRQANEDRVVLRFEVADTGCGISKEMQGRVFKAFEQEAPSTALKYGGSGLGLSIVQNLVSMMNGVIDVKSKQGQGSVFTVDLPFVKSNIEETVGRLEHAAGIHVLAVDDALSEREYMSAVLDRLDVSHACVQNSADALNELERGQREQDPYNVCIIDWTMPDANGLELTRQIRKRYGQHMTLIVVSAYEHYQADESAKASGANLFISKPVFQSSLYDLFMTLTGGKIAGEQEASMESTDLSGMRVLIAEDNAMNRLVMENMLRHKFGISCDYACDGQAAVDIFLNTPPGTYDVILMDIQMPNLNGFEATKQIRESAHPDAHTIHIIAVTANAFSEDVTKSLSSGMNAHISKPVDAEALGVALVKAYTRAAQRRQARTAGIANKGFDADPSEQQ